MNALTAESTNFFEARTAKGATIRVFGNQKQALAWWDECAAIFPGCRVDEVTREVRVSRRTVRRPAISMVQSA